MKLLISCFLVVFYSYANNLKNIDTYQASFNQSIINNSQKEILYTGNIYIKQPSNILWEYNDPIIKNVYIIKDKAIIVEPDLEQVIISKLEKEINILNLMKNSKKISENKYTSSIYNRDYTLTIQNNKLTKINYTDEIDNKVTITFSNIKQNENISKNRFEFTIPFEYDVIRK